MTTPKDILAEYERREEAAGGLSAADPKELAYDVAKHFDVPYIEVREALLNGWTSAGAG